MNAGVVDLFCGVGGLTHGLIRAGLNVLAGIDLDASCQYAFETNNIGAQFITADVSEISSGAILDLYAGCEIRILVGCAPCQPFSRLTMRYRKEEKVQGRKGDQWQNDNKWRLLYAFSEKIRDVMPHIVSMENVPELKNEQVFSDFCAELVALGYYISFGEVYCPDYGVPQNRKRLVLLASLLGEIKLIPPQYDPAEYRTVRTSIGWLPAIHHGEQSTDDLLHACSSLSTTNQKRIQQSIPDGSWEDWDEDLRLSCHRKESGRTYRSIYGRMSWDKPSPTITTQFYGYGNGRFGHPEQNRALSLREGAILQSFPSDYVFCDPIKPICKRLTGTHIGNAVPVLLGRAIGETILLHIEEIKHA